MGRRKAIPDTTIKFCVICGDIAKGINFGSLTCSSCKAFFRRNALKNPSEITCPFNSDCSIDPVRRRFCTKCRLEKCFRSGMKKEWILNDDEKALIKQKKMTKYVIRRQKELERERSMSHSSSSTSVSENSESLPITSDLDLNLNSINSDESLFDPSWNTLDSFDALFSLDLNAADDLFKSTDELTDPAELFPDLLKLTEDSDTTGQQIPDPSQLGQPSTSQDTLSPFITAHSSPSESQFSPSATPPLYLELGLPSQELLDGELYHLKELSSACSLLQNPYQRIVDSKNEDYYQGSFAIFRTQYHFHRMIRMTKRLSTFRSLPQCDQVAMLKSTLVEMLNVQSIVMFNSDRQSWRFIDDRCRSSVMVRQDLIKPFCANFELHRMMPQKFRDEWKRDSIIFDLLMAIVLFTPREEYQEGERIKEEHHRYTTLLRRYLETCKYPTKEEAFECFNQLLANVCEGRRLVADIIHFFRSFGHILQASPLFVQVFDLDKTEDGSKTTTTSLMAVDSGAAMITEQADDFELDLDSFDMI